MEFWNKTVDRTLTVDRRAVFTPFASEEMSVDPRTGRLRGAEPTRLLVVDDAAPLLRLAGTTLATDAPLALVRAARPYRAEWLVTGTEPAGWVRPGKPVRIRFFGGRSELTVSVRAPFTATRPQAFVVRSGGAVRTGRVPPGGVVRRRLPVCGVATILARGGVSLYLDRIAVTSRARGGAAASPARARAAPAANRQGGCRRS